MELESLKRETDACLEKGKGKEAMGLAQQAWATAPTTAMAGFLLAREERMANGLPFPRLRVFIVRSLTVEPLLPLLRAEALVHGFRLDIGLGGFNTYAQDILDVASPLYAFSPDVVFLAIQTRDLVPELWERFADQPPGKALAASEQAIQEYTRLVQAFRGQSGAGLVIHNLEQPLMPALGIADAQTTAGQSGCISSINSELSAMATRSTGVHVLDYDGLVARHGRLSWHDEAKWMAMRMPIAAPFHVAMAREWVRFLVAISGLTRKVLVTDLDNTLWGGVLGEDGIEGIQLGPDYPGGAYLNLQRAILDLQQSGTVLAICSKNNEADVMPVLEGHPHMLLRPSHFAAMRLNWQDKAVNLRELALKLNLGLDSMVFLDDNPVERECIRSQCPEVHVLELPPDPIRYAQVLRDYPCFSRVAMSAEDRARGDHYAAQRLRQEMQETTATLKDYLKGLAQEIAFFTLDSGNLARIAQLTQKTNQFNLTTRRYSEQNIQDLRRQGWSVHAVRVKDRFGDNGLVGVLIWRVQDQICVLDTFLLSCRVIGRGIETAMLAWLVRESLQKQAKAIEGWFLPTQKNAPAAAVYSQHGFSNMKETQDGSLWKFDLCGPTIEWPDWIAQTHKE